MTVPIKLSKVSALSGAASAGLITIGLLSLDESAQLAFPLLGFGALGISYPAMVPVSICYEIQRRRTLKAFRQQDASALELEAPKSHVSIILASNPNGMSMAGTF